jgi:hypothetical protein
MIWVDRPDRKLTSVIAVAAALINAPIRINRAARPRRKVTGVRRSPRTRRPMPGMEAAAARQTLIRMPAAVNLVLNGDERPIRLWHPILRYSAARRAFLGVKYAPRVSSIRRRMRSLTDTLRSLATSFSHRSCSSLTLTVTRSVATP